VTAGSPLLIAFNHLFRVQAHEAAVRADECVTDGSDGGAVDVVDQEMLIAFSDEREVAQHVGQLPRGNPGVTGAHGAGE